MNFENFGEALQGLGMGMSGQGAQWAKIQQQEQLMQQQQQEQEKARQQQIIEQRRKAMAEDARIGRMHLERGNLNAFNQLAQNRIKLIEGAGVDASDTIGLMQKVNGGDVAGAINDLKALEYEAVVRGYLPDLKPENVQVQSSEILSDGTVVSVLKSGQTRVTDPNGKILEGEDRTKAIRKAREYGAMTQGDRAALREEGKLKAQLKLAPEVEKAVKSAVLDAQDKSATAVTDRSNERAYEVYQTATNSLIKGLENTSTGPLAGFLPALTTNQQIADGAVAAMAPILKEMFRSAGEGTFTDSDQKILNDMIPTRSDKPDTVKAKLANIDAIIKARLGISEQRAPQPTAPPAPTVQAPTAPQDGSVMDWGNM